MVTPELFPTEVRTMGHSTCTAVSKLASFCAPYLVLSDRVSLVGIGCILGVMNLLAAGCAMLLPETLHGTYSPAVLCMMCCFSHFIRESNVA